jgi:hypothetical protein
MGPNARVDVPAALHLSTADEVRFSDGSRYSATDPANSTLTLAAPESFGFLSPQPASLTIAGSQLELKPGKTATLTAGDVSLSGTPERRAILTAPGGEIRIEARGTASEAVRVDRPSTTPGQGRLSMDHVFVGTLDGDGGRLTIRAGEADLKNAWLFANNLGRTEASGGIDLFLERRLSVADQSWINTSTPGSGKAGDLRIRADEVLVTGQSHVLSGSRPEALGSAGDMDLEVGGLLRLTDASALSTSTLGAGASGDLRIRAGRVELWSRSALSTSSSGAGPAGNIRLEADELHLDGANTSIIAWATAGGDAGQLSLQAGGLTRLTDGAYIGSDTLGSGRGGTLSLKTGVLELRSGSTLSSNTSGRGDAGHLDIQAESLRLDGTLTRLTSMAGPEASGRAGEIRIRVTGPASLTDGAWINSDNEGSGDAGHVWIDAGALELAGDSLISTDTYGAGKAGTLEIRSNSLRLASKSWITTRADVGSSGSAGDVRIDVRGPIHLTGESWILGSTAGTGPAGEISMRAETLELLDGAMISSATYGSGEAGLVSVAADRLTMIGGDLVGSHISSIANPDSTGRAGRVEVDIADAIEMLDGARIESSTYGGGAGGQVSVTAGRLSIDGRDLGLWTGISSGTDRDSSGDAGRVDVRVDGLIDLKRGALIDSSTDAIGRAGSVTVAAGALRIDGQGSALFTAITSGTTNRSTGDAGEVRVEVAGLIELRGGGQIDSSAYGAGDAGQIHVQAGSIRLDGTGEPPWNTAITSHAHYGSSGNAGDVAVDAMDRIELRHGATIDSFTMSVGDAGSVTISSAVLDIDGTGTDGFTGITSQATKHASGRVGAITIRTGALNLSHKGGINIGAYQTQAATPPAPSPERLQRIAIEADSLHLDAGHISAQSTSQFAASPIRITANRIDLSNGSRITTEAGQADAGPITISGGRLWLTDSLITTSAGTRGNGGRINLTPEYLILDGGFIQANTDAIGASGGDILIDTRALVASEGLMEIGGAVRRDFAVSRGRNIIQAAAPGGEQGTIDVTSPDLDITAALVPLTAAFEDPNDLLTDLCQGVTGSAASSLVERGAGGLPPTPLAPASVSFMGERLDRVGAR